MKGLKIKSLAISSPNQNKLSDFWGENGFVYFSILPSPFKNKRDRDCSRLFWLALVTIQLCLDSLYVTFLLNSLPSATSLLI